MLALRSYNQLRSPQFSYGIPIMPHLALLQIKPITLTNFRMLLGINNNNSLPDNEYASR